MILHHQEKPLGHPGIGPRCPPLSMGCWGFVLVVRDVGWGTLPGGVGGWSQGRV